MIVLIKWEEMIIKATNLLCWVIWGVSTNVGDPGGEVIEATGADCWDTGDGAIFCTDFIGVVFDVEAAVDTLARGVVVVTAGDDADWDDNSDVMSWDDTSFFGVIGCKAGTTFTEINNERPQGMSSAEITLEVDSLEGMWVAELYKAFVIYYNFSPLV